MINGTGTNVTFDTNYCVHRLPCGYCSLLGRDCPKQWSTTWYTNLNNAPINECSTSGETKE